MAMPNPFALFPQEIWTMILSHLEYYDDMAIMIQVYPEMAPLIKNYTWQSSFGQVVPNIAEWVNKKDLLNCRRVCKQWLLGLENFLENHPYHRAYHSNLEEVNHASWNLSEYSKCYHGQRFPASNTMFRRHLAKEYSFENCTDIQKFNQIMVGHPPERNPFLGKSLTIKPGKTVYSPHHGNFWTIALNFLRKWGKHIWYVEIITEDNQDLNYFSKMLQNVLVQLPNLKGLSIAGRLVHCSDRQARLTDITYATTSQVLPHLESFKFAVVGAGPLIHILMNYYSYKIRRLEFNSLTANGMLPYLIRITNLRELDMTGIAVDLDENWKMSLDKVLLNLEAPQLRRLKIICRHFGILDKQIILAEEDILGWIRQFSSLQHFEFPNEQIVIPDIGYPLDPDDFVHSIESVSLSDSALSISFLQRFPRLSCLQIHFKQGSFRKGITAEERFQDWFQIARLENIWELLPKLNTLVLVDDAFGFRERISRKSRSWGLSQVTEGGALIKKSSST